MARSTRKSLAGSAAAAAKKVISRRPKPAEDAAATGSDTRTAKKAPAKKAPAKKAPAKKAPATKTPGKKSPAKKTPATKTAAKKTAATKTTATKATATRAAAKKTTATRAAAKKTSPTTSQKAPVEKKAPVSASKKAPTAGKTAATAATRKAPATEAATKKTAPKKAATKKGTAKKAPVASLAVRDDEASWTKAELDEVLAELNETAERLRVELHDSEEELAGLMRDAGDGAGHDQADMGATSFERDHELTVVNNARDMLAQTERALARIDDGTYGVCESCGNPIGKMRLMAFPRATLCLSCKQREERR